MSTDMDNDQEDTDQHFARLVQEHKAQNDKERKTREDKRKVDEEAERLQLITAKMQAMLDRKKSERAASKDTKDATTTTQLEYMRACLCRI